MSNLFGTMSKFNNNFEITSKQVNKKILFFNSARFFLIIRA